MSTNGLGLRLTFALCAASLAVLTTTSRAAADPEGCRRGIAKASAAYVQTRAKALQRCEQDKIKGRLSAATDCASEASTATKIERAEAKLRTEVDRACGGGDRVCGTADDEVLGATGFPSQCPNLENGDCDGAIASCGDIASCLVCLDEAAVDQANELYHGSLVAGTSGDLNRCQQEIGKATVTFLAAKSKALQTCWDGRLQGKHAGVCPDATADPKSPAGKAAVAIAKAEAKKVERICRACGGGDRECGGGDDQTPAAIGFAATCPDVQVPGGADCGAIGTVGSLDALVQCVDCVTEFKVDCVDRAAVPAVAPYPAECNPTIEPPPPPAIGCQRGIAKASAAYVQTRAKALQRCEQDKIKGRLSAATDCASEASAATKIERAEAKLRTEVDRACGGGDRVCGTADDEVLGATGFPSQCPNLENGDCDGAIASCGDIASCLVCLDEAAVDQANELYHGSLVAGTSGDLNRCQQEIGKATVTFLAAKSKALQTCWDGRLQGKHAGVCPDATADPKSPAGKAAVAIAKAEAKKVERICRACGGGDRECGGGDDQTPAAIGFAATCPDVQVPGGADCGAIGTVGSLDALVQCVDCVTEFKVDCVDRAAVPGIASYPAVCNGGPGGPTPTRTPIATPTPTPTATPTATVPPPACSTATVTLTVQFDAPPSDPVSGVTTAVDYLQSRVVIPGSGSEQSVVDRVTNLTGVSGIFSVGDDNSVLNTGLVSLQTPIPSGPFARIVFDCVAGQTGVAAADFPCTSAVSTFLGFTVPSTCLVAVETTP